MKFPPKNRFFTKKNEIFTKRSIFHQKKHVHSLRNSEHLGKGCGIIFRNLVGQQVKNDSPFEHLSLISQITQLLQNNHGSKSLLDFDKNASFLGRDRINHFRGLNKQRWI